MKKFDQSYVKRIEEKDMTLQEASVEIGRHKEYLTRCKRTGKISEEARKALDALLEAPVVRAEKEVKKKGFFSRLFRR